MNAKKAAADKAVSYLSNGMVVGLGTGSTAYWAIEKIGERINQEGLQIKAIASSMQSEYQAKALGIPMVSFADINQIDITIDGADEVDPAANLIKGGGGALLREKIVAANSTQFFIIVDESKLVSQLGKFPLPVEIAVFGWEKTMNRLSGLGCLPARRIKEGKPFLTDNGNYIIDCEFGKIVDSAAIHEKVNAITGVVDNGLFIAMASKIIVGAADGQVKVLE